jgi:hypothetical protein
MSQQPQPASASGIGRLRVLALLLFRGVVFRLLVERGHLRAVRDDRQRLDDLRVLDREIEGDCAPGGMTDDVRGAELQRLNEVVGVLDLALVAEVGVVFRVVGHARGALVESDHAIALREQRNDRREVVG